MGWGSGGLVRDGHGGARLPTGQPRHLARAHGARRPRRADPRAKRCSRLGPACSSSTPWPACVPPLPCWHPPCGWRARSSDPPARREPQIRAGGQGKQGGRYENDTTASDEGSGRRAAAGQPRKQDRRVSATHLRWARSSAAWQRLGTAVQRHRRSCCLGSSTRRWPSRISSGLRPRSRFCACCNALSGADPSCNPA